MTLAGPRETARTIGLAASAAVILAVMVAITAVVVSSGRGSASADRSSPTIDALGFSAIVEGSVTAGPKKGTLGGLVEWTIDVERVVYDRGAFLLVGRSEKVSHTVPQQEESMTIAVPGDLEVVIGHRYAFYTGRAFFDDPEMQADWPWQATLIFDAASNYETVRGTPPSLTASVEQIRQANETQLDAAVAFASEYGPFLDSRNAGETPEQTPRILALVESRDVGLSAASEWYASLARRAAEDRQLPTDEADWEEYARSNVGGLFDRDSYVPWLVVVRLDEAARGDAQWVGLSIDGEGFLGPVGVEAGSDLVELTGYGPPTATISFMKWGAGTPAEILGEGVEVSDARAAARTGPIASIDAANSTELRGGADVVLIVDLRNGNATARLVSLSDLNVYLVQELDEPPPRSEPYPDTP